MPVRPNLQQPYNAKSGNYAVKKVRNKWAASLRSKKKQRELVGELLRVIALDRVLDRPGRCEPRAVKRRPKPYPLLNKPRQQFKEIPHRNRYWKNNPRKTRSQTKCHSEPTPSRVSVWPLAIIC
jgi:hypothetical protein